MSCFNQKSSCFCAEDEGHEGAHVCPCGGSWTEDEIVLFPGGFEDPDESLIYGFMYQGSAPSIDEYKEKSS